MKNFLVFVSPKTDGNCPRTRCYSFVMTSIMQGDLRNMTIAHSLNLARLWF